MKRNIIIMSFIILSSVLYAGKPIEIKLWPGGVPNDNGINEQKDGGPVYVAEPTLYVYPAKSPNGMAVIACPGGGYHNLAVAHEGHDMADWFNNQGITYSVLVYRMPNGNCEVPLSDAQQAIKIMREKSEEWNIRKIGIMGSSAGGHLASTAATHYDNSTRPDFQILFYPVITMGKGTHGGSKKNLLGTSPSEKLIEKFSNEKQVTPDTPPAFIIHSSDDKAVPVENSINYYMALVKNGVSASLHTYPTGGHGWGYRDAFIYKRQWTGELEKWLMEINK